MSSTTTTTDRNKRTVRRISEEAFGEGDLSVIDEVHVEDYVQHGPFPEDIRGSEGMKESARMVREAFPDFETADERYVAEDEFVLYQYTLNGTHEGPFMDLEPTCKQVSVPVMILHRFEGDKVAEVWVNADKMALFQQVGRVPDLFGQ